MSTSDKCFKVPMDPAPERQKRAAGELASNAEKCRSDDQKAWDVMLEKGWHFPWTFLCPEEQLQFEQGIEEGIRELHDDWPHESQPNNEHYFEIESKVHKELVANRK